MPRSGVNNMNKHKGFLSGLKAKIIIPVSVIMLISFAAIVLIITSICIRNIDEISGGLMSELNQHYATLIQGRLNSALNGAKALKPV
jgi:hypothetical protein